MTKQWKDTVTFQPPLGWQTVAADCGAVQVAPEESLRLASVFWGPDGDTLVSSDPTFGAIWGGRRCNKKKQQSSLG